MKSQAMQNEAERVHDAKQNRGVKQCGQSMTADEHMAGKGKGQAHDCKLILAKAERARDLDQTERPIADGSRVLSMSEAATLQSGHCPGESVRSSSFPLFLSLLRPFSTRIPIFSKTIPWHFSRSVWMAALLLFIFSILLSHKVQNF